MAIHGNSLFHNGLDLRLNSNSTKWLKLDIAAEPANTWTLVFPSNPPTVASSMVISPTGVASYAALGGGTVTSVGLALPSIFTVSGSPITSTGTLTAALASQSANTVFAAPDGSAGAPTFRALSPVDIPSLTTAKISNFTAASQALIDASILSAAGVFTQSFTSANLVGGLLTVTHSLQNQYPQVVVYNELGKVIHPDDTTATSATVSTIDLTTFIVTGTWQVTVVG